MAVALHRLRTTCEQNRTSECILLQYSKMACVFIVVFELRYHWRSIAQSIKVFSIKYLARKYFCGHALLGLADYERHSSSSLDMCSRFKFQISIEVILSALTWSSSSSLRCRNHCRVVVISCLKCVLITIFISIFNHHCHLNSHPCFHLCFTVLCSFNGYHQFLCFI